MKVLTIVGTRPQFVKAFPVSAALSAAGHDETFVHTGQHYDAGLSTVFFEELPVPRPDHHLGVGSDTHARQTAAMMEDIDDLVERGDPDAIVVYGDTNSTLAGAIVAAKRDPALIHVEAGLRSHHREMPEEINRVLVDHAADCCCAPSERARDRLRREAVAGVVVQTGDVMHDAVLAVRDRAFERSTIREDLGLEPDKYVLATVHRPRNADDPERLKTILDALAAGQEPTVLPVHPRTRETIEEYDLDPDLRLIDPVGYLDFLALLDEARAVATDSGGVQKEAFYLETPCVTLREETEWPETVESGWNALVGADPDAISETLAAASQPDTKPTPYGEGSAAERIVDAIESHA